MLAMVSLRPARRPPSAQPAMSRLRPASLQPRLPNPNRPCRPRRSMWCRVTPKRPSTPWPKYSCCSSATPSRSTRRATTPSPSSSSLPPNARARAGPMERPAAGTKTGPTAKPAAGMTGPSATGTMGMRVKRMRRPAPTQTASRAGRRPMAHQAPARALGNSPARVWPAARQPMPAQAAVQVPVPAQKPARTTPRMLTSPSANPRATST